MNFSRVNGRKLDFVVFVVLLLMVVLFKLPTINLPYYSDEISYIIPSAEWIKDHNFSPLPSPRAEGHPPLMFEMIAFALWLGNDSLWPVHLIVNIISAVALFFVYFLGKALCNRGAGIIAATMLFFTPLYFAQSGTSNLEIPLTAFGIMAIYFFLRGNKLGYILSASAMALLKEMGVLVVGAVLVYSFFKNYKKGLTFSIKELLVYASPLLMFFIGGPLLNKIAFGWLISPLQVGFHQDARMISSIPFAFIQTLYYWFIHDFRWVLTFFIIASVFSFKVFIKKSWLTFAVAFAVALLLLIFITKSGFLINVIEQNGHFVHAEKYIGIIYSLRFVISLMVFIIIVFWKEIYKQFSRSEYIIFYLVFIISLAFFSFWNVKQRNYLYLYPYFFIMAAIAMDKIFKNIRLLSYIAAFVFILLSSLVLHPISEQFHITLETTMEYTDFISVQLDAARYLESVAPDAVILTVNYPMMSEELENPLYGYVTRPLNVIYLEDRHTKEFDFFYSWPLMNKETKESIINEFGLVLDKKFEKGGKAVEVYKKPN